MPTATATPPPTAASPTTATPPLTPTASPTVPLCPGSVPDSADPAPSHPPSRSSSTHRGGHRAPVSCAARRAVDMPALHAREVVIEGPVLLHQHHDVIDESHQPPASLPATRPYRSGTPPLRGPCGVRRSPGRRPAGVDSLAQAQGVTSTIRLLPSSSRIPLASTSRTSFLHSSSAPVLVIPFAKLSRLGYSMPT